MKYLVGDEIPFPMTRLGRFHRACIALLGSGEVGGAFGDRRLQLVAHSVELAFALAPRRLRAAI